MKSSILCVTHFPKEYPLMEKLLSRIPGVGSAFRVLARALHFKRNPRDLAYIGELCATQFTQVEILSAEDVSAEHLQGRSTVVLAWPDAIGYGWKHVEDRIYSLAPPTTQVEVINGRRRHFALDRSLRNERYLPRRILERFWIGEIFFSTVFVVATPVLLIADLFRGRK